MKSHHLSFLDFWALFLGLTLSLSSLLGNVGLHSLFIKDDGSLWGMGLNDNGQLGNGTTTDLNTSQELIEANSSNPIIEITHGVLHSLFLRADGSLWSMGSNSHGQLGDGTTTDRSTPVKIVDSDVVRISAGRRHSLFLKSNGSLWGMGSNTCGELGINLAGGSNSSFDSGIDQKSPVEIVSSGVVQMSGGNHFTLFVKIDGSLWGMGETHNGRLAQPWAGSSNDTFDADYDKKVPVRILSSDVVEAEAGAQFSLIRKTDGSAWSFGDNYAGQLANGESLTNQLEPFRFLEANVTQIAASWSFGAALLKNGSLHMFGGNFVGQFGDGTTTDRNQTIEVFSSGISQISVGSTHTMIIKDDGSLWTAGGSMYGQLGNGKNGGTHADFDEGIDTKTFFQVASSNATRLPNFHEYNKPNFSPDLNSTVNLEMIWVEPGTFTMGSPVTEANRATNEIEHNVTFTKGFYLGKYEVTQAQYEAVMSGNGNSLNPTPSNWSGNPNRPVEKVSWDNAQVFLTRLNAAEQAAGRLPVGWSYVLPTEAQWEYACRAGTTTAYSFGDSISPSDANWNYGNDANQTKDVGQYSANPWGFFDMHGNVYEWTADWYNATYPTGNPVVEPTGPTSGTDRVLRGGAWTNEAAILRSARRYPNSSSYRSYSIGFRVGFQYTNKVPSELNSTAPLTIAENQPIGTIVGEFNATDPDTNATLNYSLVDGNGSTDNSLFTLDANGTLKTATTFDYESNASSYSIRVQAKDEYNATTEKVFSVSLANMNDPTTGLVSILGNGIVGQTLSVHSSLVDPDGIGTITYQWYRDSVPIVLGGTLKNKVNGIDGLNSPQNLIISGDQKHLYVIGNDDDTISWFDRNASSGVLSYGGSLKNGVGGVNGLESPQGHVLSTDNRHAYVCTASGYLTWFDRNSSTGALTFGGSLNDGVGGVDGLDISRNVVVSPDGLHIYVTAAGTESSISWFTLDTNSGIPTFGGTLKKDADGINGLHAAYGLTITQDGNHVYVTGSQDDSVSWFTRNNTSGALLHGGTFKSTEMNGARDVIVSDDQKHVYVTGHVDNSVSWFDRNASTGALTLINTSKDGDNGVNELGGARGVSLSPDQKHLYIVSFQDNAVNWFDRDTSTGVLTYGGTLKEGVNGVAGLKEAHNVLVSADGSYVYVSADVGNTVSWFPRNPVTGALSYGPSSGPNYTLTENDLGSVITVKASLLDGASFEHNISSTGTSSIQPSYQPSLPNHIVDLNSSVNLEMIWVEPGTFTMGDLSGTGASDERPVHQVTLTKGFYLGKYEVTKEQYELVMTGNDLGFSPTPYAGGGTGANTPIVYISYNEVVAFIDRFNQQQSGETQIGWEYILPAEAQWEYARRAGSTSVWGNFDLSDGPYDLSTGDSYANAQTVLEFNGSLANYNAGAGSPFLHKDVGQYPPNSWGFHDMSGSASEWVADWLGSYSSDSQTDPQGPSIGTDRVIRGGSLENQRVHQTSSNRGGSPPEWKRYSTGFRLAYMYTNKVPSELNSAAPLTIAENQPIGSIVGEFNATDPDANATLTFSLVGGNSSIDNSLFSLDANGTLKTATSFDYESNASSYSIRVQAKDEYNATTEKVFSVSLSDVNEAPSNLQSISSLTIAENQPVGTIVGELNGTDPEGHSFTYSLASNTWETHNEFFNIDANGTLRTASVLNYETIHRWKKVRVQATDELGATSIHLFPVNIEDTNDAPTSNSSVVNFTTPEGVSWSTQTWNRVYGGIGNDWLYDIIAAHDGGLVLAGTSDSNASGNKSTNSKGKKDFWVIKTDLAGNKLWDVTIGGSGDDLCAGIIPTSDANYLLFGHSDSPADGDKSQASHGDDDFWIVKIDQNGSKIWDKRYGSENTEICNFAKELNNGDIVLGGRSISDPYADKSTANLGNQDGWLLRLDENGTKIWDYSYGGSGWDELKGVDILTGGNLLLFGESSSSNGTYKNSLSKGASDYWVLKVNEVNGIIIWDKSFGGHSLDYFHHGLVNDDGSFIMVGLSTNGSASSADRQSSAKTSRDLWVVKADANGSILWEKSFAGDSTKGMGWATRIISHDDGGYLIANTTNGVAENDVSRDPHHGDTLPDYWLLKIDALGNKVWDKRYGGYGSDYSENLLSSSDGGYFLIGHSASIAGYDKAQTNQSYYSWDTDFWVLKLDEHGNKANTLYDPDGDVLTWTISGGADSSFFEINSTTGKISFSGANYANPQDTDQNNDYDVTIRATDTSGLSAEQTLRLSIEYPFDEAKGDSFLEAGLVAWYPFDGNASDMSGNGNHGTIYGAVPGTDRKGEAGKALSFDGTDDRVKIPHSLLNDRVQFTYNLWYKSTDASEPYAAFLSGANAQAYAGNSLLFSFESTKHIALFDTGGSAASYWGPTENLSNWLNIWRMLTLVRGSYGSTIYLDGQFYGKVHQINSSRGVDENGLWIGPDQDSVAGGWSPNQHLTGSVDDVRVYHRTLSEREVELLYQVTSANHFVDSAKDLEMIWVEPGTFTMGSPTSEAGRSSDETEHNVTLTKGFYLGKYEVTQAQYEIVMNGITGDLNATPSQFDGQPNRPVENVSWNDVQVFLARLNDQEAHNLPEGWAYILPTEAEWEYACRAGTSTAYSWGNSIATTNANYNPSGFNQTINVGQYVANPWGFHDMHGNVWEWTADAGVSSSSATQTDPFNLGTPSSNRVYRGGSYVSFSGSLRSAKRPSFLAPANRESFMGFRLAYRQITEPPTDLNSTTALTIAENQPSGTIVGEFNATDPEGGAITYSLISGDGFILDENGTLKTSMKFDFETDSVHTIVVQVKDEMNASMLGTFTVTISDINEAPTLGNGQSSLSLSIPEGSGAVTIPPTWDRTYGGSGWDQIYEMIHTSDGGYLFVGSSDSNVSGKKSQNSRGGKDYWAVKVDASGNQLWDKRFGGSGEDLCKGALATSDGGYFLFGTSDSPASGDRSVWRYGKDYWVVKIDANGTMLWEKTYGSGLDDICYDALELPNGNIILAGTSNSAAWAEKSQNSMGGNDFWLVELNSDGSKVRDKVFGGTGDDRLYSFVLTPDGGLLLGGINSSGVNGDISKATYGLTDYWILRLDTSWNKLWDKRYGGDSWEWLNDLAEAPDGGFFLAGQSQSSANGDISETVNHPDQGDFWVVKIDQNGTLLWENLLVADSSNYDVSLLVKPDGGLWVIGESWGSVARPNIPGYEVTAVANGESDALLFELDAHGNQLKDRWIGGPNKEWVPRILAQQNSNGFLVSARSNSVPGGDRSAIGFGGFDAWVTTFDKDGNRNHYASDPDGDSLTWSITGGVDASQFTIDPSSGDLTFAGANFESSSDADGNNTYEVTLSVTDPGGLSASKPVIVSVTDINEAPTLLNGQNSLTLSIPEGSGAVTIPATWDCTFGGSGWDHFNEMIPTNDGGYLFVGSSDSNVSGNKSQESRGGKDYWAVKVDASGNQLWDKRFGGSGEDLCKGALATSDGAYLLFGTSDSPASGDRSVSRWGKDYWVVKIDANGTMLWEKTYGSNLDDICIDALELSNGNVIIGGHSGSAAWAEKSHNSKGSSDYWLVETDQSGTKIRDAVFGGSDIDSLHSLQALPDTGLLLAGVSYSSANGDVTEEAKGDADFWVLRLDSNWNKLWDKRYGGSGQDWFDDLEAAPDGGFFLAGSTTSSANGDVTETVDNPLHADFWVVKIDQNGTLLWENMLVADSSNYGVSLLVQPDGGLWVIGESWGSVARPNIPGYEVTAVANGESDALIFELDANGNQVKDRWIGGPNEEWAPRILAQQNVDGFLVSARSNSVPGGDRSAIGFGGFDAWVATFDANGNRNHYASDPDGDTLAWSITGGADASKFTIDPNTGDLTFVGADFESPSDADGNNTYEVNLSVTDPGGLNSSKPMVVSVTDLNETPKTEVKFLSQIVAPDKISGDRFASSVSQFENQIAIGASWSDLKAGSAYIYHIESNGSASFLTKVIAPDGASGDRFGRSLSYINDQLAIGADKADAGGVGGTGAVYLYHVRPNGSAEYSTKVFAPDKMGGDMFGRSIAQSNEILAVGAYLSDQGPRDTGAVYLYRKESNESATFLKKITAFDKARLDWFGYSIDFKNDLLAVGASNSDQEGGHYYSGAVYLYEVKSNGSVKNLTKITAPDKVGNERFGTSISHSKNMLAVGATGSAPGGLANAGAVYLFQIESNGSANFLTKITAPDKATNDSFGNSVSLSGNLLAVGAAESSQEALNGAGAVYLFQIDTNGSSNFLTKITHPKKTEYDFFGGTISQSGNLLAVGATNANAVNTSNTGATYLFDVSEYQPNQPPEKPPIQNKFLPYIQTLDAEFLADGGFRFGINVLSDGGSPLTDAGIQISEDLQFSNASNFPATGSSGTNEFSVVSTDLEPSKTFYYRSYATNSVGINYGVSKVLHSPSTQNSWWSNANEQAAGWHTSDWFGSFLPYNNGWIYHAKMGWAFAQPDISNGLWLWVKHHGWLWTKEGVWPYLFQNTSAGWLYFIKKKDGIARFYDYTTKSIK